MISKNSLLSQCGSTSANLDEKTRHLNSVTEAGPILRNSYNYTENQIHVEEQKHNRKRVMVIDDNSYNLFVMEELIKQADSEIMIDTALNGQLALDQIIAVNSDSHFYDVLFIDLHMPVLDGYQVRSTLITFLIDRNGFETNAQRWDNQP